MMMMMMMMMMMILPRIYIIHALNQHSAGSKTVRGERIVSENERVEKAEVGKQATEHEVSATICKATNWRLGREFSKIFDEMLLKSFARKFLPTKYKPVK